MIRSRGLQGFQLVVQALPGVDFLFPQKAINAISISAHTSPRASPQCAMRADSHEKQLSSIQKFHLPVSTLTGD